MQQLGRYEIVAELGRGAMGTVYQARDPRIDRVVAIKTISVQSAEASEHDYRQRFFREAQAAGKLAHPGIVTVYDISEDEKTHTPYIVMEYIAGQTLDAMMRNAGRRLPLATTLDLIRQIAEALDYAHAQGIVHRDIKPANIIVTQEGRAKITDFGVAKLTLTDFTMPGQVFGTPSYMSPEQLSGEAVTGRSDLFSLGVILYSMLAGERPFSADTVTALTFQVVYKEHTPVTHQNPGLGAEFDHVIYRALAKKPEDRYQRGQEMAADLGDLSRGRLPRSMKAATTSRAIDRTQSALDAGGAAAAPRRAPASSANAQQRAMVRGSTAVATTQPQTAPASIAFWNRLLGAQPWKQRPVQVGVVFAVIFIVLFAAAVHRINQRNNRAFGNSYLRFICFHDFRLAEFTVWVDDRVVLIGKLSGRPREFSQPIRVPAGNRTVRVRVLSADGNYDQMSKISGDLPGGAERTLRAICYRGQIMNLEWQ